MVCFLVLLVVRRDDGPDFAAAASIANSLESLACLELVLAFEENSDFLNSVGGANRVNWLLDVNVLEAIGSKVVSRCLQEHMAGREILLVVVTVQEKAHTVDHVVMTITAVGVQQAPNGHK
jgi:hypothetical protein